MNEKQNAKALKIEALKKRKEQLLAQIRDLEQTQTAKKRKEETRLKILIGAAYLADNAAHGDIKTPIKAVLARAITHKKDQDFLARLGWF